MVYDFFRQPCYAPWPLPADYPVVELDLGCGRGGFLLALAQRYPERLVIGIDLLRGRLNLVERKVQRRGLRNTALLCTSGWDVAGYRFPDRCFDRVHVLCPDPWPKDRHEARRLLSCEFLGRLATKLKPGGVLHVSSDNAPYLEFVRRAIAPLPHYRQDDAAIADVADLKTDFERLWESQGLAVRHTAYRVVGAGTPAGPPA
jgi:tRNA (guanine-N7-)-methyltransferase